MEEDGGVLAAFEAPDFHAPLAVWTEVQQPGDGGGEVLRVAAADGLLDEEEGFAGAEPAEGAAGEPGAGDGAFVLVAAVRAEEPIEDEMELLVVVRHGFVAVALDLGKGFAGAKGVFLEVAEADGPLAEGAEGGEFAVGGGIPGIMGAGADVVAAPDDEVFDDALADGAGNAVAPKLQGAGEGGVQPDGGGGIALPGLAEGQAGLHPLVRQGAEGDAAFEVAGGKEIGKGAGLLGAATEQVFGGADGVFVVHGELEGAFAAGELGAEVPRGFEGGGDGGGGLAQGGLNGGMFVKCAFEAGVGEF